MSSSGVDNKSAGSSFRVPRRSFKGAPTSSSMQLRDNGAWIRRYVPTKYTRFEFGAHAYTEAKRPPFCVVNALRSGKNPGPRVWGTTGEERQLWGSWQRVPRTYGVSSKRRRR